MTRARMTQLQQALEHQGWRIEGEFAPDELLHVERERIVWALAHPGTGASERLEFQLFDPLGRVTQRLADLSHVDARGKGTRLYFSKIRSPQWRAELREFVRGLY
ncbi:hypothetical protein [Pseudomonas sp. CGJS7]|uniref:hypothetical protein n=1 Tax=Pseudomonas sp. CGJS7 TaxID=3109348 RepID=UPI00300B6655